MSLDMSRLVVTLALLIAASPAGAQDSGAPPREPLAPELRMLDELTRAMRDAMQAYGEKIASWVEQLGRLLDDPDAYEAPTMLPNGDILIRRKPGAPPPKRPDAENDAGGLDL